MNILLAALTGTSHAGDGTGFVSALTAILLLTFGLFGAVISGGMDLTSLNYMLKELYSDKKVFELMYKRNPLLALLPKFTKFGGKYRPIPVIYNGNSGRSADWQSARDNRNPVEGIEFLLTRKKDYASILMDNESIEASAEDPMSFLRGKAKEIDSMLHGISRSLCIALYGTGSGVRGRLASTQNVALTVVTLADPNDIVFFEVNQVIRLSAAENAGAVRAGELQIRSISTQDGTFTVDQAINAGIGAATASDFISLDGDFRAMLSGLEAWLPGNTVTATPFFGVDRTVHEQRLGGTRIDGTGGTYEEVLKDLLSQCNRVEADIDLVLVNDAVFTALDKSLESTSMRTNPGKSAVATIGLSGIWVNTRRGPVEVIPDVNCPADRMFALQKDTWELASLGPAPRIFDTDGLTMLRSSTADAVEAAAQYYANLGCYAPGNNGVAEINPPDPV